MTAKRGRANKTGRSKPKFVMLYEWFMATEAWRAKSPTARALYLELKRRFKGSNNGEIQLSHREAAQLLNLTKNTVGKFFSELTELGFIAKTRGSFLGPSGTGETSMWRLTEEAAAGVPATKEFTRWRPDPTATGKKKPVPKTGTPRPKKRDTSPPDPVLDTRKMPEVSQNLGRNGQGHVPVIGTSIHLPYPPDISHEPDLSETVLILTPTSAKTHKHLKGAR